MQDYYRVVSSTRELTDMILKWFGEQLTEKQDNKIDKYNEKAITKFCNNKEILFNLRNILMDINDWNENSIDLAIKSYQTDNNYSTPEVNQPIRIALTGSTKSPSLGLILFIYGKKESIERINALLTYLDYI